MANYIVPSTETNEIILCPYCKGLGYEVVENRINLYESDYEDKECYLCKGKRVVNRKTVTIYECL
jgi:hypothetical protein